jgi:hypothetical protein
MTARQLDTRPLMVTAAATAALIALAALAAATSPAAARDLWGAPPHPVLAGSATELLDVLATNLPPLALPLLLAATLAGHGRTSRALGDLATAAVMATNALLIGAALGTWGFRLLPYLPHLPFELAALACSCSAWWSRRAHPRPLAHLALAALGIAVLAALLEVYATPHTG